MKEKNVIHTHTQWNIIQPQKEGNPTICYNMYETWGHYVKWYKPNRKREILYGIPYMWNL